MLDYLNLGSTPSDEDCAQVGSPDYQNRANKELDAYKAQLERMFPGLETHKRMEFKKMWFPHDFGSYGEIVRHQCIFYNHKFHIHHPCIQPPFV